MHRIAALSASILLVAACGSSGSSSDDSTAAVTAVEVSTPSVSAAVAEVVTSDVSTSTPDAPPPVVTDAPATPATTAPATTTAVPATPQTTAPSIRELVDGGATINLAHAGGDQAAPHSTMFAFAESIAAGSDVLELDVQLTGDGVLIVQHDDTVDKTTNITGPVAELTLAEIQALDNAYWFSPMCWPCQDRPVDEYVYRGVRTGEVPPPAGYTAEDFRVATFREVATAFPDLPLDIEIKGSYPDAVAVVEQLAAEIVELDRVDSVVVVSFDDELIDAFHELLPDAAVSPGLARLTEWFLNGVELEPYFEIVQLPPFQGDIEVVTPALMDRIHDEGRVAWVWPNDGQTQENQAFYEVLLGYGVDGIIAGRPAELTAAIGG